MTSRNQLFKFAEALSRDAYMRVFRPAWSQATPPVTGPLHFWKPTEGEHGALTGRTERE